jgi:hypothetical protein
LNIRAGAAIFRHLPFPAINDRNHELARQDRITRWARNGTEGIGERARE